MIYEPPSSNLIDKSTPKNVWLSVLIGLGFMFASFLVLCGVAVHFALESLGYSEGNSFIENHNTLLDSDLLPYLIVPIWCISMFVGGYVSGKRSFDKWVTASISIPVVVLCFWLPLQYMTTTKISISQVLIVLFVVPSALTGGFLGKKGA